MTAPNARIVGLADAPSGDPDAVRALATKWRAELSGDGNLGAAAHLTNSQVNATSSWNSPAATIFHDLLPKFGDALNKAAARVTSLATDVDKYATDLDDVQGHPGDGRTDTWWGLSKKLTERTAAINALGTKVKGVISQPVSTTPEAAKKIPKWPNAGDFSIPSDGGSIASGATWRALSQWQCNAWMNWAHLTGDIDAEAIAVTTLQNQLSAYATRVDGFRKSAVNRFDNVKSDGAATGSLSPLTAVGENGYLPQPTDPPIPFSEVASYDYTVVPGDNLSTIAGTAYGSQTWQRIYAKNKAKIGGNPNLINPGQVLTITHPTAMAGGVAVTTVGIKSFGTPPPPPTQPTTAPVPLQLPVPLPLGGAPTAAQTNLQSGLKKVWANPDNPGLTPAENTQLQQVRLEPIYGADGTPGPHGQTRGQAFAHWALKHPS
ncbi:MAG: LysM peptidoglycan-binding domain-containing protein [Candidatus Dormibacteria bacterium]